MTAAPFKIPIMNKISRISISVSTLLLLSTFLTGCGHSQAGNETTNAVTVPQLEVFHLTRSDLHTSLQIPGELIAYQRVDLYAKVSSFVRKMYVDVGSEVQAGQLMAAMEAPEINAQMSGAESRLKSQEAIYLASKATYDRLLETSKTPGTVSQNDLDIAAAKQKSDFAQLEAARAARREITDTRNYLEIRAPFSGIVTARNVSAGAYVGPAGKGSDMPIFTLQEQKKLRLAVSVPEAYTAYLNNQTEVSFSVKSLSGQQFTAKVARLAGALDTRLRAQHIEMDVINNEKHLLPGMVAEVAIPMSGNAKAFAIPSSAVLNSTEGVYVIKVQDKKTIWVPVITGRKDDNQTEVTGDLKENDILVKNATEEVRNGSPAAALKMDNK